MPCCQGRLLWSVGGPKNVIRVLGAWSSSPNSLAGQGQLLQGQEQVERLLALGDVRWIILTGRGLRMSKRVRPRRQEGGEALEVKQKPVSRVPQTGTRG